MINKSIHQCKAIVFSFGIFIFLIAATYGWIKLQYGFNFMDEGYHMTESWRLANGDDFLKDKITGALTNYTLINNLIFRIDPDITLLGFRKLQYLLTIFSLFLFGIAIFKFSRQYVYLPYIFSLFAFTGLDPVGIISNLSYQTYPHLLLTLYLSFLLLGLHAEKSSTKNFFYLLSGFCLWAISLSLLYLLPIILAPIFMFFWSRQFNPKSYSFSFKELSYVLSPFIFSWTAFIIIFNKPYLMNVLASINVALSMPSHSSRLIGINWDAIRYISMAIAYLTLFFIFTKKKVHFLFQITGCAGLSILMFLIIKTSCFGFFAPYCKSYFSKPMWFSSLLIAFSFLFLIYMIAKYLLKKEFSQEHELPIILMIPFVICASLMAIFSGLGLLVVSQSSIPAIAAFSFIYSSIRKDHVFDNYKNAVTLILLLCPFYYTTMRFDWNFTFFDAPPQQEKVKIEKGFGNGIYTNNLYYQLYHWIMMNSEKYVQKNDYSISYVVSPMVHMITKTRPSLDDTFITFERSTNYYMKAVKKMEEDRRNPKIAFVFERMPMLIPVSIEQGTYTWLPKQFDFSTSPDPISSYIRANMKQVSEFKISDDNIIRCFIDDKHMQNNLIKISTENKSSS